MNDYLCGLKIPKEKELDLTVF